MLYLILTAALVYLIVLYGIYRFIRKGCIDSSGNITKYGENEFEYIMHCLKLIIYIAIGIIALASLINDNLDDVNLYLLFMIALVECTDHLMNLIINKKEYKKADKKIKEYKKSKRCQ